MIPSSEESAADIERTARRAAKLNLPITTSIGGSAASGNCGRSMSDALEARSGQPPPTAMPNRTISPLPLSAIAWTDWRLHATYEPALARFTHLEISDVRGGESFLRVPLRQGDIVVGDRAYARAPSLEKVVSAGADFIVRTGWTSVRLTTRRATGRLERHL